MGARPATRDFTAADVLNALGRLEAAGIGYWLDGGWGVDALLATQTRAHDDLDLVIDQEDLERAQATLAAVRFAHAREVTPGLPSRLVLLDDCGRQIDLHPVVFDASGDGWQPLGDGAWVTYPAEGIAGSGVVAGRLVPCLSADLQVWHHLGYPWDAQDWQDMEALATRFGLGLPPKPG